MDDSPEILSPARRLRGRLLSALAPLAALALVVVFFVAAEFVQAAWQWRAEGLEDPVRHSTFGEFLRDYDSKFVGGRTARQVLVQSAWVAVAALGMTVIIVAGGIDLSIGNTLALACCALAWCLDRGYSGGAAVLACLAAGGACGLLNGTLVSALRVPPFIVTLGTAMLFLGISKGITGEVTISPRTVPDAIGNLLRATEGHTTLFLPGGVWLALALAALTAAVLRFTVFGRHVFALGSNESTARLCGINVPATKVAVYTLSGLFAGIAGVYLFARLKVGVPTEGAGKELQVIAAVVIGGGSLSGGRGSVLGTLAGAAMMTTIQTGCSLLGAPNRVQDIILGAIIVAAVTLDQYRQRRSAG